MIEYTCIDCGGRIISYRFSEPAEPATCSNCHWIRTHVPAKDQAAARERLGVTLVTDRLAKVIERLEALRPGFYGNDRMALDLVVIIAKEALRRRQPRSTFMATMALERLMDCPVEELAERLRDAAQTAEDLLEKMPPRKT